MIIKTNSIFGLYMYVWLKIQINLVRNHAHWQKLDDIKQNKIRTNRNKEKERDREMAS